MSIYVASSGKTTLERDMAYSNFSEGGRHYVPCIIRGPVDLGCLARSLGIIEGDCISTEIYKICREGDHLYMAIDVEKAFSLGKTPGEIAKYILIISDICSNK